MTQHAESYRWGDKSDPFGRSLSTIERASKNSLENIDEHTTGKKINDNIRSNYVSLIMTPKHRVIYKSSEQKNEKV